MPGNTNDIKVAQECVEVLPPTRHLLADKGYDSTSFRQWLRKRGTKPVIPPRRNRKVRYRYDKQIYKQRNRVERMFGRLKDYRRIATRFDRNVRNYLAAVCIAVTVIWWLA